MPADGGSKGTGLLHLPGRDGADGRWGPLVIPCVGKCGRAAGGVEGASGSHADEFMSLISQRGVAVAGVTRAQVFVGSGSKITSEGLGMSCGVQVSGKALAVNLRLLEF